MKHITILFLTAGLLMAADCAKELDKLDKDITKVKQAKKLNETKLNYLSKLKAKIKANCTDGQINSLKLQELKITEKQAYELDRLNQDKTRLKQKEEKLKTKHDKELKKLEEKKAKSKGKEKIESN